MELENTNSILELINNLLQINNSADGIKKAILTKTISS